MKPAAGRGMKGLPAQAPIPRCLGHCLTHNSHRQGHLVAFFATLISLMGGMDQ